MSRVQEGRGLLDTSVVIDLHLLSSAGLPRELLVSAVTLAELAQGPSATDDPAERASRQDLLQRVEGTFDPLPFDAAAARAYGRVCAGVRTAGRQPRGRFPDLQIAAVALANSLPLYTRNPDDFRGLDSLIVLVPV